MITRVAALLIALLLLTAAVLKWVDLPGRNSVFYVVIGGLEALLALALVLYNKSWRAWVVLALVVSVWMGFSFYVTLFGLPCSCLGGSITLPRGMSLGLNGLMFLGAWGILHRYPTQPVRFKRLVWFFAAMFIIGFIISSLYYSN